MLEKFVPPVPATNETNADFEQEIISYTRSKLRTLVIRDRGLDEKGELTAEHLREESKAYISYVDARTGGVKLEDYAFLLSDK